MGPLLLLVLLTSTTSIVAGDPIINPHGAPATGLTVTLTATPSAGVVPLLIQFAANVTGVASGRYTWNFGDGTGLVQNASGQDDLSHEYTEPGSYTVGVEVTSGGSSGNASTVVVLSSGPVVVTIGATPLSGSAPLTVRFSSSASGGSGTYVGATWTFGNGEVGSGFRVNETYTAPGSYHAILNVTDSDGRSGVAGVWINVSAGGTTPGPTVSTQALEIGATVAILAVGLAVVFYLFRREGTPPPAERSGAVATTPLPPPAPTPPSPPPTPETPPLAAPTPAVSPSSEVATPPTAAHVAPVPEAETEATEPAVIPVASRPSPPTVPGEVLRLSQRLVLHLHRQGTLPPEAVAPPAFTQAGMAQALGTRQNTLATVLRRLVSAGVLTSDVRHVQGQPRRVKVYHLTPRGEALAKDLRIQAGRISTSSSDSPPKPDK